jgi:diaminohydroxyphosphoribosylaminopyrimidine deaminase / 5-amino-6-(5-phosphoribosylamino)uracil reductase
VLVLPAHDGRVDLRALLAALGERQVISVLAEGGAGLIGSLRDSDLIDSVVAVLAPRLIGGVSAPGAVGGEGAGSLAETLDLADIEVERCGSDVIVTGYSVR